MGAEKQVMLRLWWEQFYGLKGYILWDYENINHRSCQQTKFMDYIHYKLLHVAGWIIQCGKKNIIGGLFCLTANFLQWPTFGHVRRWVAWKNGGLLQLEQNMTTLFLVFRDLGFSLQLHQRIESELSFV